jgi:hypothetical protein
MYYWCIAYVFEKKDDVKIYLIALGSGKRKIGIRICNNFERGRIWEAQKFQIWVGPDSVHGL